MARTSEEYIGLPTVSNSVYVVKEAVVCLHNSELYKTEARTKESLNFKRAARHCC